MTSLQKKHTSKSWVIGLTGGIASGKSTVAKVFSDHSIPIICADEIAHQILESDRLVQKKITTQLGKEFIKNKQVDRRRLGAHVFKNKKYLKILEPIIHPQIKQEIQKQLKFHKNNRTPIIVMNVPLLFEVGLNKLCNHIVCVYATQKQQIDRLKKRNQLSRQQALLRIRSQMSLKEKCRLSDTVIKNTSSILNLKKWANQFLKSVQNQV